jgi:23S rRNA (cytosine1962-C5)-methyltransferase
MNKDPLFFPLISDDIDKTNPLKNCIRKNYRHLRKWAKRTKTNCFRIYDRDIKEYPLIIDFYRGYFCVQYFSFNRDDDSPSIELKTLINDILKALFEVDPDLVYWHSRIKRKRTEQYEKEDDQNKFFTVLEYGVKFKVNLQDYLDTGIFLDHRETRRLVAGLSKGKRLLNLFAYTSSFSVHAALAGAAFTKSVDLSNTYTSWSRDNFNLNSIPADNNHIVRADCMRFIKDAAHLKETYDIIVIDPPTISRSKKMDGMFDIQEDYVFLITDALTLLPEKDGVIFFSTNSRKFIFDTNFFPECFIKDISEKTIPLDFHQKKIHRCWKITKRDVEDPANARRFYD